MRLSLYYSSGYEFFFFGQTAKRREFKEKIETQKPKI